MLFKKYTAYHWRGGFTPRNGVVLARKRPLSYYVRMLYYNISFWPKSGVQLGATRFFRPSKVAKSSTYGHFTGVARALAIIVGQPRQGSSSLQPLNLSFFCLNTGEVKGNIYRKREKWLFFNQLKFFYYETKILFFKRFWPTPLCNLQVF